MLARYARWLHTRWPAGTVEPLPEIDSEGRTSVPGVFVAGDLTGIPLLKFALASGAAAARRVATDPGLRSAPAEAGTLDLVIVGAGVAGMAAALEARQLGLSFAVLEANEPFSTLVHFPARKPIYTFPTEFHPESPLQVTADLKEPLVDELRRQVAESGIASLDGRAERIVSEGTQCRVEVAGRPALRARRVIVAIGRSGRHRRLGVDGETMNKVFNRLHDPRDAAGSRALVVGGGDAAVETALALADAGADVTLCHRGAELSRPKPENLSRLEARAATERAAASPALDGRLEVRLETRVEEIHADRVVLVSHGVRESLANDVVFAMIGREPPLDFFRRSKIRIRGERTAWQAVGLAALLIFCVWLYDWKSGGVFAALWRRQGWFPHDLPDLFARAGGAIAASAAEPATLLGTLAISASSPAFWYTLAYSVVLVVFGVRRVRRRRTPYVTAQTVTLMAVQVLPLFLVPEILLPWLHHRGALPAGLADALFPAVDYGHGREFWRAYGFILAWPLNVYNVFTPEPLPAWLAISFVQTLVLIPLAVLAFGKGAYCGWICSCGGLAETLGDTQRHKMPHGPGWNRLNMAGQFVLLVALALLALRVAGWLLPEGNAAARVFEPIKEGYKWTVDVFLAGVLGYGLYFALSGRVWCRFLCPLAAWMHVIARFSRFAILAEKKRCISCNVCTSVCHQGIDVMSFANKGLPMIDPQCVRCSACVHACPTGVLQFGQAARDGTWIALDRLAASPVRMRERE